MKIYGLDFTSAPSLKKPIACIECSSESHFPLLKMVRLMKFSSFEGFEAFLGVEGPWVAAMDFPFGLPRRLIANLFWPGSWKKYVEFISAMGLKRFELQLANYRMGQPTGDKHHLRFADALAGSCSPMMLYGVPVGKMFFQGAPRLLRSGVSLLPCHPTAEDRVVLEGYPALVARKWIGKRSYKSDESTKQTHNKEEMRRAIIAGLRSSHLRIHYDLDLEMSDTLARECVLDPSGDTLDAVLCSIQAAWAFAQRDFGIPLQCDKDEGWIVDPSLIRALSFQNDNCRFDQERNPKSKASTTGP